MHACTQNEPYQDPPQWASGESDAPNELFPTGEVDEPERGLDALFWPPLLWAARNQDADTCRELLSLGADASHVTPAGMTAVLAALHGGAELYEVCPNEI
jgi:hypothetical protein